MNLESFPWLSSIVLLPLIGALIMPFLSSKEGEDNTLPRNISLSFLFIDFLLIIGVLFQKFNTSDSSLQLVERASWLPSIGLRVVSWRRWVICSFNSIKWVNYIFISCG